MFTCIIQSIHASQTFHSYQEVKEYDDNQRLQYQNEIKEHEQNVAQELLVKHYMCSPPESTERYAINKIEECNFDDGKVATSPAIFNVWQIAHAIQFNAFRCEGKIQREDYWCGQHVDNAFDMIWNAFIIEPQECHRIGTILKARSFLEEKDIAKKDRIPPKIEGHAYDRTFYGEVPKWNKWAKIRYNNNTKGLAKTTGHGYCQKHGLKVEMFSIHVLISEANITHNKNEDALTINGRQRSCKYTEDECKPTNIDTMTYAWKHDKSCLLYKIAESTGKMIKWDSRYFAIIEQETQTEIKDEKYDNNKNPKMKFEVMTKQIYAPCGRNSHDGHVFFHTQYKNLLVSWTGGYNVKTGKEVIIKQDPNTYGMKNDYAGYHSNIMQSTKKKRNETYYEEHQNGNRMDSVETTHQEGNKIISDKGIWVGSIDYELHQNIKTDYITFKIFEVLHEDDLKVLQNICELERMQLQTVLALAIESPALAGYLLTGNRSNFIHIDGNIAYLFACKQELSPLYLDGKCYNKIPVWFNQQIKYVDKVTRELQDTAIEESCTTNDNLITLDPDEENSWYILTPKPHPHPGPKTFRPRLANAKLNQYTSIDTKSIGLYSENQISGFWAKVNAARNDETIAKAFTIDNSRDNPDITPYQNGPGNINNQYNVLYVNGKQKVLYLDHMISKGYFETQFKKAFGEICYYMEKAGSIFAFLLFLKFLLDMICGILRSFEIYTLSGKTFRIATSLAVGMLNLGYLAATHDNYVNKKNKQQEYSEDNNERPPVYNNEHRQEDKRKMLQKIHKRSIRNETHPTDTGSEHTEIETNAYFSSPPYTMNLGDNKRFKEDTHVVRAPPYTETHVDPQTGRILPETHYPYTTRLPTHLDHNGDHTLPHYEQQEMIITGPRTQTIVAGQRYGPHGPDMSHRQTQQEIIDITQSPPSQNPTYQPRPMYGPYPENYYRPIETDPRLLTQNPYIDPNIPSRARFLRNITDPNMIGQGQHRDNMIHNPTPLTNPNLSPPRQYPVIHIQDTPSPERQPFQHINSQNTPIQQIHYLSDSDNTTPNSSHNTSIASTIILTPGTPGSQDEMETNSPSKTNHIPDLRTENRFDGEDMERE